MALSSPCDGVNLSTDSSIQKCYFACCVQGFHLTWYHELCSHQLLQRQHIALSCWWLSRSSPPILSFGVLAEPWLKSPEFEMVGLTVLARVLLEIICLAYLACMFVPNKMWHPWCRVNIAQKWQAICSALAASGLPALVMSIYHRIKEVPELPLVVEDKVQGYKTTREAVSLLKILKA